jgi:hypothetical protein
MVIISLKLDKSLLDRIDATASEDGTNRSESIRRYLGAVIAWRRDRAIWETVQDRAVAAGTTPHRTLFDLITVGLSAVVRKPRHPTTPDLFRAIPASPLDDAAPTSSPQSAR